MPLLNPPLEWLWIFPHFYNNYIIHSNFSHNYIFFFIWSDPIVTVTPYHSLGILSFGVRLCRDPDSTAIRWPVDFVLPIQLLPLQFRVIWSQTSGHLFGISHLDSSIICHGVLIITFTLHWWVKQLMKKEIISGLGSCYHSSEKRITSCVNVCNLIGWLH